MSYEANDIVSLSQGRAFREKIGMYLSADRQEAINLGLRELVVNSQDEYQVYKPKDAFVKIILDSKEKIISIEDNLRGIPVDIREDGINSLTAAMLINHSGGKHISGAYASAVGVNGVGNKVVNHTSKWLEVIVKRDQKIWFQRFTSTEEGATPETDVKKIGICKKNETGTFIKYQPDERVYGKCFIDVSKLRQMLKEISYFTIGLKIILINDGKEEIFISNNGLIDGLSEKNRLSEPFSYFYNQDDCEVELALQWVKKKGNLRGYANGLYMPDGGAFITGFRTSLTKIFNSLANEKFEGEQVRGLLDGFVSVKVKVGQFSNQSKTALANPEARTATAAAITNCIKDFYTKRRKDFEVVVELLSKIEKAELAAERARNAILNHQKDQLPSVKRKILSSDKLRDAKKLGEESILLCVEGNSAGGSMSIGRDPNKFGVLMLRGKGINALTNSIEDVLENEEVKLLLQALGITYGQKYNPKKLRYGKVAIASDADDDGFHVGLLIMVMLHKLVPGFIEDGRLLWLRAPLYSVKNKKEQAYFYNDDELNNRKIQGDIIKYKGLGQLSEEDLKQSMFNPKWQRLEELVYTEEAIDTLEELMGNDVQPRKEFVFNKIDFGDFNYE